jgi:hypothetical protein
MVKEGLPSAYNWNQDRNIYIPPLHQHIIRTPSKRNKARAGSEEHWGWRMHAKPVIFFSNGTVIYVRDWHTVASFVSRFCWSAIATIHLLWLLSPYNGKKSNCYGDHSTHKSKIFAIWPFKIRAENLLKSETLQNTRSVYKKTVVFLSACNL